MHHAVMDSLLTKVSRAVSAITDLGDEPFQSTEFRRPKSLHVTTCYLGAPIGDAQRKVLAASKSSLANSSKVFNFFLPPNSLNIALYIYIYYNKIIISSRSVPTCLVRLRLVSQDATFDCSITHLVAAPGALAFAVVDGSRLRGEGVPMAEEQRSELPRAATAANCLVEISGRPHITMCTQRPWQPRHSNDVLEVPAAFFCQADGFYWILRL